ncbi:MAG: integrase domain-containing protein [Burkholderiales bacterium]
MATAKITDPHIALSLRFQAAFGLRREESLKIRPGIADQGSVLVMQTSWTKGGRPRNSDPDGRADGLLARRRRWSDPAA